ncbi:MAG TPA: chorismate-binding protein, partial [Pyrinomonadaceae bacterium]|nr:chorismate-binding protein [Pyrinomonadaceae bacterium]
KDRAENIMIVDLVRNDLGRVCEYGTVKVERLCLIKEYKSHFHMVSEVTGRLRENTRLSDVFSAVFPYGSVTGAPKKRTLEIISELESRQRGLSMGTFGYFLPQNHWKTSTGDKHLNHRLFRGLQQNPILRAAVAIRTMTRFQNQITFNVGGGITIDSDPFNEYKETEIKSLALLDAIEQAFDSQMLVVE